jgi:hypothetical protein
MPLIVVCASNYLLEKDIFVVLLLWFERFFPLLGFASLNVIWINIAVKEIPRMMLKILQKVRFISRLGKWF